jgi:N-formylglutamate amidohydrolase
MEEIKKKKPFQRINRERKRQNLGWGRRAGRLCPAAAEKGEHRWWDGRRLTFAQR